MFSPQPALPRRQMPLTPVGAVGHLLGGVFDEVPGRRVGHLQPGLFHQVLAVHHERTLAVERRGVQLAVERQAARRRRAGDRSESVETLQRHQPALLAPDRRLVHADGQNVVLAALGRNVRRDLLAKVVLFERDPVQLDVRDWPW